MTNPPNAVRPTKTNLSLVSPLSDQSVLCLQWAAMGPTFIHIASKDWFDWVDAQTNPSLCSRHRPQAWLCHNAAKLKGCNSVGGFISQFVSF